MDTRYRNTDLDLVAAIPLDPLTRHLVSAGMVDLGAYQNAQGDWHTSFEIVGDEDDRFHETAEATIAAMLDILEDLPDPEKRLFDRCTLREFNVAYDVGDAPRGFDESMSAATLARMAALGTSLRITLYPSEP